MPGANDRQPATDREPKDPSVPAPFTRIEASLQKRDSIVIGRGSECDLVVKDAKASRTHCRLSRTPEGFQLEDLGSKNGTYVEGNRIVEPVPLKANQTFKIGDTVFYLAS